MFLGSGGKLQWFFFTKRNSFY